MVFIKKLSSTHYQRKWESKGPDYFDSLRGKFLGAHFYEKLAKSGQWGLKYSAYTSKNLAI